ncbi:MAG: YicC/YloC family endoribonuclease [Bacillota bacterium]
MILSMTGFGRGEASGEHLTITVETKSVNHRYLDFAIRMPRELSSLEEQVRAAFRKQITRGRVDVFIKFVQKESAGQTVAINEALATAYIEQSRRLSAAAGLIWDLTATKLLCLPEVVQVEDAEIDVDEATALLSEAVQQAVAGLVQMRTAEGARLAEDVRSYLDQISASLTLVEERSPSVVEEYREKLNSRLQELLPEGVLDEARLAQEVAILADRACIAEETVRLRSHLQQARELLAEKTAVGRKLDFLVQEMNREINTIGSKANDLQIVNLVVEMKSDLEKIREQVQNIE